MEVSNSDDNHGKEEGKLRTKHKGKHDKPKPWDNDSIDHWKIEKFDPSWNESGMLEVSSFSTLFPQYREKYLQEVWPIVRGALKQFDISCELNLVEGSMTVSTTRKTRDPYIIVKARDLIKLLSRSVPAPQAIKILDDEMQCDIIKIGGLIRNKERFVKRRQHLMGPNSSTLKAIEILTGCYVLIQGNTVAAMGSFRGLKQVRRIVEECIQNKLHPIYHIRTLMMRRELEKVPELANESWDRFLPKFKKKNVKQKKVKSKEKKPYTPFPPPQQPSKIDLQLESGEYFLPESKKSEKKFMEKQEKQAIPGKFLGSWEVDKSENFDEYLTAKGYGWFMRQMVKLASITKIFEKSKEKPGFYNCKIYTSKKNVEWLGWQTGKEFQAEYLDEAQHKITFDVANDKLIEKHVLVDKPTEKPDIYEYTINGDGFLVMRMEFNNVVTNRFYKKSSA